ncbi:hypothetical protein Vafri_6933 [Volvox africanus]|uniref:Uncharacterized protein n=1 Tax=Volvox africanus TaxID=51714 RepID=A0A8J4B156_9CHLO|nr:hypothetical protein Vafri_6933 [Volvox africanus]
MRLLVLSASSGALYMYQNYARTDVDNTDESVAFATRLFHVNKLLLQASGRETQQGDAAAGTRQGGWVRGSNSADGGSATILGVGMRRPNCPRPSASSEFHSRLAVRQWHLDSEQWHLAEDSDADVLFALSVPPGWDPGAAEYLAMSIRDAFIHAHRPQLLYLKAAAAANTGPAAAAASPLQYAVRLPPDSVSTLFTRQALRLLCKLAQDAMDSVVYHGLHPCWLFVAHVDSFMGAAPGPTRLGHSDGSSGGASSRGNPEGSGNGGEATEGAGPKKKKQKGKGFLKSFLGVLRKGGAKKETAEMEGGGVGPASTPGQGLEGQFGAPPGPVGHLQHLVLPPAELRRDPRYPPWGASSIAATLCQVRPPPEEALRLAGRNGGHTSEPTPDGGAPLTYPELEDVELAIEMKAIPACRCGAFQ